MIMSFGVTPILVKGQGQVNPVGTSDNDNLKRVLDERYIGLLGFIRMQPKLTALLWTRTWIAFTSQPWTAYATSQYPRPNPFSPNHECFYRFPCRFRTNYAESRRFVPFCAAA